MEDITIGIGDACKTLARVGAATLVISASAIVLWFILARNKK